MNSLQIYKLTPTEMVRAMVNLGWSQEEIANSVGSSQPTISRLLSDEHHNVRYQIVERLRELLTSCNELTELADSTDVDPSSN